jgi:hypothetical protein
MYNTRITISIPRYILKLLDRKIKPRQRSVYVRKLVESDLARDIVNNPVEEFLCLRKELPKISKNKILMAIEEGRI